MIQDIPETDPDRGASFYSLAPFFVFVVFYLGISIYARDFYKVPMPVAFLVASATAILQNNKRDFSYKVEVFAKGMGDTNIMLMSLIFILAGAFAAVAKGMGAVDAAVLIAQNLIPAKFMLTGVFIVSCFISLAIGTSCGTIAALTPIAVGLVESMNVPGELLIGAVVGGAMFGDNMSMISDTTIVVTRTQDVAMRDKFLANFRMVLPAAILCLVIYLCSGRSVSPMDVPAISWKHVLAIMPYLMILVLALCGLNVMGLLFCGIILAAVIGELNGSFDIWGMLDCCGKGTLAMAETLIVALLAGGLLRMIRFNGGIAFLMLRIGKKIRTRRNCEFGVAVLVAAINLFTANNTVALVIAGPLAKELSQKFNCIPQRIAAILDVASCIVQGIIPYGAQILIALGVAKTAGLSISSFSLIGKLYYPFLMILALAMYIIIGAKDHKEDTAADKTI